MASEAIRNPYVTGNSRDTKTGTRYQVLGISVREERKLSAVRPFVASGLAPDVKDKNA